MAVDAERDKKEDQGEKNDESGALTGFREHRKSLGYFSII